jgi:CRP/FNR family transcriptional regulator, anaerobic regulatory protein
MSAMPVFANEPSLRATAVVQSPERAQFDIEALGNRLRLFRRRVRAGEQLFRPGQPMHALYLVHAGYFKLSVNSADGREKVTGFRMRGDLLGLDALGAESYGAEAVALDTSEVWVLPCAQLDDIATRAPGFREHITAMLAHEIRRDWSWMLSIGTLSADQRVVAFLLDLSDRQRALGFSPSQLMLRMTRAELGNFLSLQLETVTRALSRLAQAALISVDRREVRLLDPGALRDSLGTAC